MVGVVYNVQPQPPVEADTRWFPAGAVTIGVEYRVVDPDALAETYGDDAEAMTEIEENSPEGGFVDSGVSIHVRGTADGHEYLRFDCFEGEPHYHYVRPTGDHNNVVEFDAAAHGDMLDFTVDRLRTRMAEMLMHAGGDAVATQLDAAVQEPAIDAVEQLARSARDVQRASGST